MYSDLYIENGIVVDANWDDELSRPAQYYRRRPEDDIWADADDDYPGIDPEAWWLP